MSLSQAEETQIAGTQGKEIEESEKLRREISELVDENRKLRKRISDLIAEARNGNTREENIERTSCNEKTNKAAMPNLREGYDGNAT